MPEVNLPPQLRLWQGFERYLTLLLIGLIKAYRLTLSPYVGRQCRFDPTCSAYGLEALRLHGPWRGSWLALRRIGRCHPIKALGGGFGFDPVPPRDKTPTHH